MLFEFKILINYSQVKQKNGWKIHYWPERASRWKISHTEQKAKWWKLWGMNKRLEFRAKRTNMPIISIQNQEKGTDGEEAIII